MKSSSVLLVRSSTTDRSADFPVIRQENPLLDEAWNRRLSGLSDYSFFHTAQWAGALSNTYGFVPVYFTATHQDKLASVLPFMEVNSWLTGRRGISLPFSDKCEPLGSSEKTLSSLFEAALNHARSSRWRYLEFRVETPDAVLLQKAPPALSFFGHRLSIFADAEYLFSRLDNSVRRAIRKADKSGLTVEVSQSLDALRDYYSLHCKTRRHHGLPPQPFKFFLNIHQRVISQNMGVVISAKHRGNTVASAVFFYAGSQAIYKYGASEASAREFRGNNLVMWEAIKWCAANGMKTLDFGRTSLANEGLRRFKLGWGTRESSIHYFRYHPHKNAFVASRDEARGWHNSFFRVLPIFLARAVGNGIYKHLA